MDCRAILFDLDGVLIDSTSCVERHWKTWARKHGLDADGILRIAHGVRNIDTMRLIVPHLDVEEEARQFAADEVADTAGVVFVDGASAVLASLAGASWAVVTSCGADLAHARIEATHLPPPPVLVTGTDVARGKPDPDPYLLAARQLGVRPQDCVVVEDAPAGIQAGKKAAMRVIGVAFTYGREDLLAGGADVAVDRLSSLKIRQTHGTLSIVADAA